MAAARRTSIAPLVVVLLVVGLVAWLLLGGGVQQLAPPAPPAGVPFQVPERITAYALQYGGNFITYSDPDYRFTIDYPIGYNAQVNSPTGGRVSFTATTYEYSEAVNVVINPGGFTDADFAQMDAEFPEATVVRKEKTQIGGREAFLAELEFQPFEDSRERVYIRQAAITGCTDAAGKPFTALISGAVPQALWADLDTIDYMIYSFRCRS
jgi:hypothetical protein